MNIKNESKNAFLEEIEIFENSRINFEVYCLLNNWTNERIIEFLNFYPEFLDEKILSLFYSINNEKIKLLISSKKELSNNLINKIVNDSGDILSVVSLTARNENLIFLLSQNQDYRVKQNLIHNKNVSEEILLILSEDLSYKIREALCYKPGLPKIVLENLSKDSDKEISYKAFKRLELMGYGGYVK